MASEQNSCDNTTELLSSHCEPNIESLNCERLNYEEERMKSFASWPVHFPVDPCRLAKAGFYYTGIGDDVVCFSCRGHVKNWNYGDIVLKKHSDLYPNCDFIKNGSNNIPLLKASVKFKFQPLVMEKIITNTDCSQSNLIDYNKMKSESERIETFSGNWPLSFINISDLAHAGFFYTGVDCKVQCPYCKGVISNWEPDSIPIQEHLKQFPWCDYLSQNIVQVKEGPSWFQFSSQDVCGNMVKQTDSSFNSTLPSKRRINDNLQHSNLEDLGVHLHKAPVHPHQASLTARLTSFASWPSNAPVSREDLATAGFFYIGVTDRTICFHCNGGLCAWEEGDDPWEEHARWFPACDFLRLNKGSDFIKSCTIKSLSKLKENFPYESNNLSSKEPILKKVDEAMKSNLVKYVLETELFPLYIVRAALLLQIKQTGSNFSNTDDLCVAASYLKEEMEKQSFDMKPQPLQAENLNISEHFSESCLISVGPSVNNRTCKSSPKSEESHSQENSEKMAGVTEQSNSLKEDDFICKICMDEKVGVLFLPCGHLNTCTICASALKHCPMCRKSIQATVRAFLN